MKGRVALIEPLKGGGDIAALVVDGRLEELLVDPVATDAPQPGAYYRAIIDRPLKGIGGAIVRLGSGQVGFLRETKGLRPGDPLLVQVSTFTDGDKAAPVSAKLLFKSRYAIITPGARGRNIARGIRDPEERERLAGIAAAAMQGADEALGLILRSACEGVDANAISADIKDMRELAVRILPEAGGREPALLLAAPGAADIAWRDWVNPDPDEVRQHKGALEEMGVWEQIEALFSPMVALTGGASMAVEATRALVAVDVNTGGDFSPAAGLKASIAAARELPRQLRLRGFGGQIVIDFAPVPKGERRQVEAELRAALKSDAVDTALVGWTPLGHLELQRKRERRVLERALLKDR